MQGKITDFGSAPYQFEKNGSGSFYIQLETINGKSTVVWGVGLEDALDESGFGIGDSVCILHNGSSSVQVPINKGAGKGEYIQTKRNHFKIVPINQGSQLGNGYGKKIKVGGQSSSIPSDELSVGSKVIILLLFAFFGLIGVFSIISASR